MHVCRGDYQNKPLVSPCALTADLSLLTGKFLSVSLLEMVHILCRVSHNNTKRSFLMSCKNKHHERWTVDLIHCARVNLSYLNIVIASYIVDGWKTGRWRCAVVTALATVDMSRRPPTTTANTFLLLRNKHQNG